MLKPNSEDLALQLISLIAFDKYKPLREDFEDMSDYFVQTIYWNRSYVIGLQQVEGEKWKIIFINIGAAVALLILVPPIGVIGWFLFIASRAANLISDLNRLQEKTKLSPENSPKLYRALAMLPSYDDEALREFKKTHRSNSRQEIQRSYRKKIKGV